MGHFGMSQAYHLRYQQSNPWLLGNRPQVQTFGSYMAPAPTFWQPQPIMFGSYGNNCCHSGGNSTAPLIAGLVGLVAGGVLGYAASKKAAAQPQYQPMYQQPAYAYRPYPQYIPGQTGVFGTGYANQGMDLTSNLEQLYKAKGYNIVYNSDGTYSATDKNGNNVKGATGVTYQQMQIALG